MEHVQKQMISGSLIGNILDQFDAHPISEDFSLTLIQTIILSRPVSKDLVLRGVDEATDFFVERDCPSSLDKLCRIATAIHNLDEQTLIVDMQEAFGPVQYFDRWLMIVLLNKMVECGEWEYDYLKQCIQVAQLKCSQTQTVDLKQIRALKQRFHSLFESVYDLNDLFEIPASDLIQ